MMWFLQTNDTVYTRVINTLIDRKGEAFNKFPRCLAFTCQLSYLEYEKAMTNFDNREYQKAIEELTNVMEKYPDADIVVGCQLNIASAYEQLGEIQKAYNVFKEIMTKYENDPLQTNAVAFARAHVQYIEHKQLVEVAK